MANYLWTGKRGDRVVRQHTHNEEETLKLLTVLMTEIGGEGTSGHLKAESILAKVKAGRPQGIVNEENGAEIVFQLDDVEPGELQA